MIQPDDISEADLCQRTGLKADDLRHARNHHFTKGIHWFRREKGAVIWRGEALSSLLAYLKLPEDVLTKKNAAPSDVAQVCATPEAVVLLEIHRGASEGILNRAMVEAKSPGCRVLGRGDVLRVLVTDNRKMKPGQLIWCRHMQEDLYHLAPAPRADHSRTEANL